VMLRHDIFVLYCLLAVSGMGDGDSNAQRFPGDEISHSAGFGSCVGPFESLLVLFAVGCGAVLGAIWWMDSFAFFGFWDVVSQARLDAGK
jgi:hypothetical protein